MNRSTIMNSNDGPEVLREQASTLGSQYGVELVGEDESTTEGPTTLEEAKGTTTTTTDLDGAESVLDNNDDSEEDTIMEEPGCGTHVASLLEAFLVTSPSQIGQMGGVLQQQQEPHHQHPADAEIANEDPISDDGTTSGNNSCCASGEAATRPEKSRGEPQEESAATGCCWKWFTQIRQIGWTCLLMLFLLLVMGAVVGGVCGSGLCSSSKSISQSSSSSEGGKGDPTATPSDNSGDKVDGPNNSCQRASGPFNVGGFAAMGVLTDDGRSTAPICPPLNSFTNPHTNKTGLWYQVTGGDQVLRASTCATASINATNWVADDSNNNMTMSDAIPSSDTLLSVYQGSCSGLENDDSLECVAANDDACPNGGAAVSWYAAKGVTYYVLVQGAEGVVALHMDYNELNGICEEALPLTLGIVTAGSMQNAGELVIFTCSLELARGGQKWYSIRGTGDWLKASTCHARTDFSARVDVLKAGTEEAPCNTAACATLRDSECENGNQMVWQSEPGQVYYIMVYKTSFRAGDNFELSVNVLDPAENDECANPTTIVADGSLVEGSTLAATLDADNYLFTGAPPCGSTEVLHPGVWFQLTATSDDVLLASTCHNQTNYATEIFVYESVDGEFACESLACVENAGFQFCSELEELQWSVYWPTVAGQTYWILVHGAIRGLFPSVGDFGLTVKPFVTEPNNLCIDAVDIDETLYSTTILGSTVAATLDEDIPTCGSAFSQAPGIWYRVVGTGRSMRASTCDPLTDFDTQITIFGSASCENLICVSTDDNSCGVQSSVAWSSTEGLTYFILVHGRLASSVGNFALIVEDYEPVMPNDFCEAAVSPPVNGSVVLGSTRGATFDNTLSCTDVTNIAPGVWYKVDGTGTLLKASLCSDETNYETAMTVFAGDCIELECIAANVMGIGDSCGRKSELSWATSINVTYYILVHGWDTRVGDFGLVLEEPETAVRNNYCVSALFLPPSPDVVYDSTIGSSREDTPMCSNITQTGGGVWYMVLGTGNRMVASTCNSDNEDAVTDFDTKISIFAGDCGNLVCTLADDNYCGAQSRLVWLSEQDVTYYILVHGKDEDEGSFGLVVNDFVPDTTNDFCTAAQGPLLPTGQTFYGSTRNSSFDGMENCGGVSNTSPGVWFFVVGTGERLFADTCNEKTNFDTKLSIFAGRDCDNLRCITGNDDGCGLQSTLSWDSELGEFYWILLHGFDTYGVGNYGFKVSGSALFN